MSALWCGRGTAAFRIKAPSLVTAIIAHGRRRVSAQPSNWEGLDWSWLALHRIIMPPHGGLMKTKIADIASLEDGKGYCVKAKGVSLFLVKAHPPVRPLENKRPHLGLPLARRTT